MVQVTVNEGILEGEQVQNEYGGTFYSFKGIPYAKPPLGDLRFKAPQPPKTWDGVRSAKEFGPRAVQNDLLSQTGQVGSEDCLYLNVYTPEIKPDKPLPVMFWIHGGAFMFGSGDDDFQGPEFLIRHEVIVVTINYRLEVLGFLCLNTEDVPGNAGMKDQVAALRWVNKNIASFGGDPNNVTIFGESAGGASVSFHLISPMSKGLFKRAIPQSGASTSYWAQATNPRERALVLARKLGFYSENDIELYEFFKSQPTETLISAVVPITLAEKEVNFVNVFFSIVDEQKFGNNERFFYGDLADVISNNIHEGVEIMTGFTTDEGLISLGNMEVIKKQLEMAREFPEFFVTNPFRLNLPVKRQLELGKKIRDYYFSKQMIIPDDWEKLVKFYSMTMFVFPTLQWVKICARAEKNKVYLYQFSCKSERNVFAHIVGLSEIIGNRPVTCHADDVMYIFNAKIVGKKVDKDSDAFKLIDTVTKLWTNFSKYGNPTPDDSLGVKWIPYSLDNQDYLEIGNELASETRPVDEEEILFWESIFKYFGQK